MITCASRQISLRQPLALLVMGAVLLACALALFCGSADQEVDELIETGLNHCDAGQFDSAASCFEEVLQGDSTLSVVAYYLALAYLNLNRPQDAITQLDRAISRDTLDYRLYYHRAVAYERLALYEEAFADLSKCLSLNPSYVDAYYAMGLTHLHAGEYDAAIVELTNAIELDPMYAGAYNTRGVSYCRLGLYTSALGDFRRAVDIDPDYPYTYHSMACAYEEMGEWDSAIKAIETLLYHYTPDYDRDKDSLRVKILEMSEKMSAQ